MSKGNTGVAGTQAASAQSRWKVVEVELVAQSLIEYVPVFVVARTSPKSVMEGFGHQTAARTSRVPIAFGEQTDFQLSPDAS